MYRFPITIDKTKVTGTNTNFPYLFSEGCSSIPSGFWSHVTDTSTGLDIRFFDSDGVTELKRDIVLYNSGTTKVEVWVQIPSLGAASNKVMYCQYGGPTRANDTTVWTDIGCKSCIHFQNLMNDSAEGYTATISTPTQISNGKINKAYSFNGTSDEASISRSTAPVSKLSYTISTWAYCLGSNGDNEQVITSDGPTSYNYILALTNTRNLNSDGYPGWELLGFDGSGWRGVGSNQAISGQYNGWHHVVGTYDGDKFRIYVDGSLMNTSAHYVLSNTPITTIYVGDFIYLSHFYGYIEELRHYNVVKDINWVATEYANQNAPSTFSTCGVENSFPKAKFQIKIDKTKVQGSHTNFPYLFSDLCANIPSGFWRDVVNTSGLDIRFYDTDKSTELKREIVLFDPLNKKLEIWVQIPFLSSTSDKYIWCVYGGSTRANDTTVWSDIGAIGAYHFQGNANDSSGSGNNGTVTSATQATGFINSAYDYAGGNSFITLPLFTLSNQFVLSLWFKSSDTTHNYKTIFTKGASDGTADAQLILDYSGFTARKLSFYCTGGGSTRITTTADMNDGLWHQVTAKRDGNNFTMWVDRALVNTATASLNTNYDSYEADFGKAPGQGLYFYGIIDEARILTGSGVSNIALDWVNTEYNNQNSPATFSQCSAETSNAGKLRGVFFG